MSVTAVLSNTDRRFRTFAEITSVVAVESLTEIETGMLSVDESETAVDSDTTTFNNRDKVGTSVVAVLSETEKTFKTIVTASETVVESVATTEIDEMKTDSLTAEESNTDDVIGILIVTESVIAVESFTDNNSKLSIVGTSVTAVVSVESPTENVTGILSVITSVTAVESEGGNTLAMNETVAVEKMDGEMLVVQVGV